MRNKINKTKLWQTLNKVMKKSQWAQIRMMLIVVTSHLDNWRSIFVRYHQVKFKGSSIKFKLEINQKVIQQCNIVQADLSNPKITKMIMINYNDYPRMTKIIRNIIKIYKSESGHVKLIIGISSYQIRS